jgi:Zn-finger nucleic acid-binding protein
MRCPVDRNPLSMQTIDTIAFATCSECAGVWLTRKALVAPSVEPNALPAASRRPRGAKRGGRRLRVCPECIHPLESQRVEGVEIERCVYCKGVWLDAGEYDAVRKRIEVQLPASIKDRDDTAPDVLGAGFDAAIEALISMLFGGHL